MAIERTVGYDPFTKKYCKVIIDESEKTYTIINGQDVAAIIEDNKIAQNLPPAQTDFGRHIARIPDDIMLDLRRRGIWQDIAARKRWLNDPDNKNFRRDSSNI